MTQIGQQLLSAALAEFGVTDLAEIGAPGGQKAVRHVRLNGDDLVLKVISIGASAPDALARAEREVELLKSLDNENVVRVESHLAKLGTPVEGAAWLEEYLDGQDLLALLNRHWSWTDTRDLGIQVAKGLMAGHARGVVHRDLSPNNVRRISSGTYKVLDFGFARHTLRSGLTVAGQPGTPGYLSPEHLNSYSGAPMPPSDIFCVGILMYAALAGRLPIPYHGDDADYVSRLSRVAMDPISTHRPDIDQAPAALVMRCLHRQPARRFRNGQHLVDALEVLQ